MEENMEKEEKFLYEVETNIDKEEIIKMASVFKKDFYKAYAIYSIFLNLILKKQEKTILKVSYFIMMDLQQGVLPMFYITMNTKLNI